MLSNIEFMQEVKSLKEIDVLGKKVLIRVDFNVPMDEHQNITEDNRIREALKTIEYCIDHRAKSVILVSHLGQPKGGFEEKYSLKPIQKRLERLLNHTVSLATTLEEAEAQGQNDGAVILLENIRFFEGETKDSPELAKKLGALCEIYVNDAFGASHRKHSSIYSITDFVPVKVAGFLLRREIEAFSKALFNPIKPITLVVGGAKVSSKITLLKNIMKKVDKIIIGGAMSNTFLKALGYDVKASLFEKEYLGEALIIMDEAKRNKVNLYLPVDVVMTDNIETPIDIKITPIQDMLDGFSAVDIGPASARLFEEVIEQSNTIIWNGPMGIFETDKFARGTFKVAHAIADSYAYSIAGGGDTVSAIIKADEKENISFISTGGGASLELLEGKILPGFEKLDRK